MMKSSSSSLLLLFLLGTMVFVALVGGGGALEVGLSDTNSESERESALVGVEHQETSTNFLTGQSQEEQQAIMANPDIQAVLNGIAIGYSCCLCVDDVDSDLFVVEIANRNAESARAPDAVDRLIAGILAGTGKGGVVTSEFTRGNVHATIVSNVNELKVLSVALSKILSFLFICY